MKQIRLFIIICQLCFFGGCQDKSPNEVEPFQCSYFELKNQEIEVKNEGGNFIKGDIEFAIEGNLKKLGNAEFETSISDSSIVNYNSTTERYMTNYETGFISKHNSIIQVLCAIDRDLQDTTLSVENRDLLFREKLSRRAEYFELLLGNEKSDKTARKVLPKKKAINDNHIKESTKDEVVKKTIKERIEISIQLDEKSNGYSEIFLNNAKAPLSPNSTPKNPRVYVTSNKTKPQLIQVITRNGNVCELEQVFDIAKINDFPIRFTPICKN